MNHASSQVKAIRSLVNALEDLQAKGRERIWLSREATELLASLPSRMAAQHTSSGRAVTAGSAAGAALSAELSAAPPSVTALNPSGASAAEKVASLKTLAADWEPARRLGSLRDTMVFSVGDPSADLMLVGEAPGAEEERQGEPFVGNAGQLLDKILQAMGIDRGDAYISNICKFRPAMPDQGTGNRKPTPEEMKACLPFVLTEIDIIQPKAIVALGGTAAEGLLGLGESVGRMRNQFHDLNGIPVMVTYHPSYLLRNQAMGERRKVWEDMLLIMEKLGMPVSEKQRSFFTK